MGKYFDEPEEKEVIEEIPVPVIEEVVEPTAGETPISVQAEPIVVHDGVISRIPK